MASFPRNDFLDVWSIEQNSTEAPLLFLGGDAEKTAKPVFQLGRFTAAGQKHTNRSIQP